MFFGPKKGGNPTKAFLRWNFFPTVESGSFGPSWCGNLSTWNLFVPIMLLPAKTFFFWNMVVCNVLGLANKHRTHEGAKNFQWFPGADVHLNFWHNKTKNSEDQVLLQIPFKTMSKSYVFGPHKRGHSTTNLFEIRCVCVRNIFSLANKHRTPQKHFS